MIDEEELLDGSIEELLLEDELDEDELLEVELDTPLETELVVVVGNGTVGPVELLLLLPPLALALLITMSKVEVELSKAFKVMVKVLSPTTKGLLPVPLIITLLKEEVTSMLAVVTLFSTVQE